MPTNVVRTPEDEKHWAQAKEAAAKEGQGTNWAYVMGVYTRIKKNAKRNKRLQKAFPDVHAHFTDWVNGVAERVTSRKIPQVETKPATIKSLKKANDGRRLLELYHRTPTRNVPSILKSGLIPRHGKPTQDENPAYNAVYFHTGIGRCGELKFDEPTTILRVRLPIDKDTAQRLRPDEDTFCEDAAQCVADGEPVAYRGVVDPQHIAPLQPYGNKRDKAVTSVNKSVHIDLEKAVLTAAKRNKLPASDFGVKPKKGKKKSTSGRFPMPDKEHARLALQDLPKAKNLSREERREIRTKAERMLGTKD